MVVERSLASFLSFSLKIASSSYSYKIESIFPLLHSVSIPNLAIIAPFLISTLTPLHCLEENKECFKENWAKPPLFLIINPITKQFQQLPTKYEILQTRIKLSSKHVNQEFNEQQSCLEDNYPKNKHHPPPQKFSNKSCPCFKLSTYQS